MIIALKIVICVLLVFAALGIACAVRIGWRRDTPADPFATPFGEMPGFTAEQLRHIAPVRRYGCDPLRRSFAARPLPPLPGNAFCCKPIRSSAGALQADDAGDGRSSFPSGPAAIGNFLRRVI
jgi:hypothetical protein